MGIVTATISPSNLPNQVSTNDPQGEVVFPKSSSTGAFFGASPIAQPGGGGTFRGVIANTTIYTSTQSPTIVAANTTGERAMTVTGVLSTDFVMVSKPTSQAGLAVCSSRVSAANTIQVTFANLTSSGITPTASEGYLVEAIPAALTSSIALTPAAVAANTTAEQQFTVSGLTVGMFVAVNKPTVQAGLGIVDARVVATNTLGITFLNATASPITPTAAESYLVYASRELSVAPVMMVINAALTPVSVAANTAAEQTFTVAGLVSGTFVQVDKPSIQPGLGIGGVRVSAANTLAINYINATGNAIVPTAETYVVSWYPTTPPSAGSATATSSTPSAAATGALVALGLIAGP